jgi:hypothetical protein
MEWYELALNPEAISQLYTQPPLLRGVELSEVTLQRDGPTVHLRAILAHPPDRPPARWTGHGYNAAQIQLDFFDLEAIQISGWSTTNLTNIGIERPSQDRIQLRAEGPTCMVNITCRFFRIAHIRGYLRSEDPGAADG